MREGLFSALPVYRLNAAWDHLNLARMTQGTSFGKIDGMLNGNAKNIEISNGQLQRFNLLLDTVKTDNIPQKISVKAVDNIARIGGRTKPFCREWPEYSCPCSKNFLTKKSAFMPPWKMMFFSINGTIHEGGREYLVKRGFFSGVDVINQNKDNRVGFKDYAEKDQTDHQFQRGPHCSMKCLEGGFTMKMIRRPVWMTLILCSLLIFACVTINIYFPAEKVESVAGRNRG